MTTETKPYYYTVNPPQVVTSRDGRTVTAVVSTHNDWLEAATRCFKLNDEAKARKAA